MNNEILDLIINLQEDIRIGQEINSELKQENERLKENNQAMQEEMAITWQKCNDYKTRCEKALEKINYYKYFISLTKLEEHILNTLDNILQKKT